MREKKDSTKVVEIRLTTVQKNRIVLVSRDKNITYSKQVRDLLDKHLQAEIGQTSLLEQAEPPTDASTTGETGKAVERLEIRFSDADKVELHKAAKRLNTTVSSLIKTLIDKHLVIPSRNENEKQG